MQRPANDWEWHILGEVAKRVNKSAPHLSSSYMTVSRFFSSKTRNLVKSVQGVSLSPMEVFLCPNWLHWDLFSTWSTWQTRTKLSPNLLPFTSQPRYSKHFVCTLFDNYHLFQILELVHQLHLMDLIHADLKPDNFLVTDLPGMGLQYPFLKYIPSFIKLLFRPSQSGFANDRLWKSVRHAAGNLTRYQDEYCTFFSDSRAHCLHRPSLDFWTSVRRDARASSLASSHWLLWRRRHCLLPSHRKISQGISFAQFHAIMCFGLKGEKV